MSGYKNINSEMESKLRVPEEKLTHILDTKLIGFGKTFYFFQDFWLRIWYGIIIIGKTMRNLFYDFSNIPSFFNGRM